MIIAVVVIATTTCAHTHTQHCPSPFLPLSSQVYSQSKGRYLCQDKYYGRELTPETVPLALEQFFSLNLDHTPRSCNRGNSIVSALLARIAVLREALDSLSGLRLYSTSILVL